MNNTHFTYNNEVDKSSLKQGDVLKNSNGLEKLIKKYHPHYANPEYTHFQVLTQSCDLVQRNSKCSSRYIIIAAVRSLETVIKRAIEQYAEKSVEIENNIYCSKKHKDKLSSVVSSLFDNNDKNFFFLKAAPEHKLLDDSCTFLHLSVAIKANEHYSLCLESKILELKENFRAKLGWMVGNLYSRVGTEDYVPAALPDKNDFNQLIEDTLKKHIGWINQDNFPHFKKAAASGHSYEKTLEITLDSIKKQDIQRINNFTQCLKTEADLTSEQVQKIKIFLASDQGKRFISN